MLLRPIRYLLWVVGNLFRRLARPPEYVSFLLEGAYEELPPPKAPFVQRKLLGGTKPSVSLKELAERFRRIAGDRRVKGVVLHIRPLTTQFAHLQTLRDLIGELRAAGKRVVAWSPSYGTGSYFVASSADQILLQPGGMIDSLGFKQSYVFLADALAQVGLKADFIQISPYKSAADPLMRTSMSEEVRQMANWLMDSAYEDYLAGIAAGRGTDREGARLIVDGSPYIDNQATQTRVVDGIVAEEDLPTYLRTSEREARIRLWEKAKRSLLKPALPPRGKYVALVRIEGDIVDGRSQRPPFKLPGRIPLVSGPRAGDLTVVQDLRKAASDKRAGAVVVYVESGGGSAVSSEAMARAMEKAASGKPLVASMGWLAGSGGYWVTTPARWVVAQSATLTGSIGVLNGKVITQGLFEKLLFHREILSRGESVLMDSGSRPFTEEERKKIWEAIDRIYDQFLDRVSRARKRSREEIDAVGAGRVWTGRQALERGLVDEIGGLDRAIEKARQLGGLSPRARVREIRIKKESLAPRADVAAALEYALEGISMINRSQGLCLVPFVWLGESSL